MNREAIYAALFALASRAPGLVTTGRKLLHWSDVDPSLRPALFQAQGSETAMPRPANGMPRKWLLRAKLYVYVSTASVASPGEALNPILDAIEAMFAPMPGRQTQNLGGLVVSAEIEGEIATDEGTLGDDAVAIVPIVILVA